MRYLEQRFITPFRSTKTYSTDEISASVTPDTIGHRVLIEDRRAESISNSIFERLDLLIDFVENTLPQGENDDPAIALTKLKAIEQALTDNNVMCSIPMFLVATFAEGLQLKPFTEHALIYAEENQYRRSHIEAHIDEKFSHMDCDLSSLLYISIAEKLSLPICMIEVPRHNFVRWTFSDGSYLNWDTNFGYNRYTDDQYAKKYDASEDQIKKGTYLSNMTSENVMGYFNFCRGNTFELDSKPHGAIQEYLTSIERYPQSPISRNNIAWKYATSKDAQTLISSKDALIFAREAVDIVRSDTYLDTLACVLAESGDFEEAVIVEMEAYKMNPRPDYQVMIEAFQNKQTWLDINDAKDS